MRDKVINILLIALTALIVLCWKMCNKKHDLQTQVETYSAANAGLEKNVNKLGQEVTKTQLMLSDYSTIKKKLQTSDSTVKKLQQFIDKHTLSATVLNTTTHDHGSGHTTVSGGEVVIKHDSTFIYPVYKTQWNERWSNGAITATKDSISRNIFFMNEYDIKQSYQLNGHGLGKYFRQRVPMVEVVNLNPNTKTTALKSYSLQPDKRPKRRAFVIGGAIGAIITYGIIHLK